MEWEKSQVIYYLSYISFITCHVPAKSSFDQKLKFEIHPSANQWQRVTSNEAKSGGILQKAGTIQVGDNWSLLTHFTAFTARKH